jgi:hypothetical protein
VDCAGAKAEGSSNLQDAMALTQLANNLALDLRLDSRSAKPFALSSARLLRSGQNGIVWMQC